MTSVVDKYYRRIIQNIDNVRMKFDISSLLVKSKEHDSKINTNVSDISSNLSKINTNESDISENLSKININVSDISENLSKINTNESDISENLSKINTNVSDISSNLSKINTIEQNNSKVDNIIFNNNNVIVNQSFNFNKDIHLYKLFEKIFENDFDGELVIVSDISYKYDNLENDLNRLTHLYQFYDDKDVLFYTITLDNHDFGISDVNKNILNVKDKFCLNVNNKNKIKVMLSLTRINQWGSGIIDLELVNYNSINIIYKEKIDIVTKINTIDDNLSEINRKTDNNNTLISNNFTSILPLKSHYTIDNIWLFNLNFVKDINFLSNIKKILVYDNIINYQFKVNSFIEINESLIYKYDNIKSYYFVLREVYVLMDQNDIILDEFSFNIKSKGAIYRNLHIYDNQYFFKVQSNITTLKLKVYLERINYDNDMEFNLQLNSEFQNNFIALKYFKYTS